MKKFTVKPKLSASTTVRVGEQIGSTGDWLFLGRLSETGSLTSVHFDVGSEHVVAFFGKRGSGKSFALGSFLEGLCPRSPESTISNISRARGIVLFDPLGVFQWMDVPLDESVELPILMEQLRLRRGWPLATEPLDVKVWHPRGTRTETTPSHHADFAIDYADLNAADWGDLLNVDILQDRMGQLLNDAYVKVVIEGWFDGKRRYEPKTDYVADDLISCVRGDTELLANYQPETRRAVIQQLTVYRRNPLFADQGTRLTEFLRPGQLSVLVMNKLSDELRLVLVMTIIRKVIEARVTASEDEKHLKIRSDLTDEERAVLERRLAQAVPPCWIVVDEAQNVLPSERRTAATDILVKLVREGRNFGISFMVTTQQPTALDQRILSQVDTIIAHKLTVQSDIEYVRRNLKSNLPEEVKYGNTVLQFDELMRSLDVGQALVSNTEAPRSFLLEIRPRVSVHGGF